MASGSHVFCCNDWRAVWRTRPQRCTFLAFSRHGETLTYDSPKVIRSPHVYPSVVLRHRSAPSHIATASNGSPRGVVAFPTAGNRGWCCLWRDSERRVHARLIVARQVANEHVVPRRELERQVSTLARRDVAFFAHRGELVFFDIAISVHWELIGTEVGLEHDQLVCFRGGRVLNMKHDVAGRGGVR